MNEKFVEWKKSISGKTVGVVGIGISNRPLIEMLVGFGADVTAYDKTDREKLGEICEKLEQMGVKLSLGENYLNTLDDEIIFKTPGMRFDTPQLLKASNNGSIITSEMEVFFDICPAKIVAVTGSDGKTTTTTIIGKLLEQGNNKLWLGGNIGKPLLAEIEKIQKDDFVVVELSSFQLHTMRKSPHIAVITNISPNHLDMHKDMDEYIDAKKNIFSYQHEDDILVLNADDPITESFKDEAKGKVVMFSYNQFLPEGLYINSDVIFYGNFPVLPIEKIKILGKYNVENYMAAMAAVADFVSLEDIENVAESFGGVEHRCEFVRRVNGVDYYNSSIDSSPNRTKETLSVFDKKVILITGGKDKGIGYEQLGPTLLENVKKLILIGATADKIQESLIQADENHGIEIFRCNDYNSVVETAKKIAEEGDIVLLSPASTSFDMFANFEQRGNLFKQLVNDL